MDLNVSLLQSVLCSPLPCSLTDTPALPCASTMQLKRADILFDKLTAV